MNRFRAGSRIVRYEYTVLGQMSFGELRASGRSSRWRWPCRTPGPRPGAVKALRTRALSRGQEIQDILSSLKMLVTTSQSS